MFIIQMDQIAKQGDVFTVSSGNALADALALGEAIATNDHTATKPTLLLVNPAGYQYDVYPLNLLISQGGTVAGGLIRVLFATDSGSRVSSVTGQRTPVNMNPEQRVSNVLFYMAYAGNLVTATAATAGVKYFGERTLDFNVSTGTQVQDIFDFAGGLILPPGNSLLVYIGAVTTAPTFSFELNWFERKR